MIDDKNDKEKHLIIKMVRLTNFEFRESFQKAFRLWFSRTPTSLPTSDTPVSKFFKKFQILLQKVPFSLDFENYVVKAGIGKGKWAEIPWIGIRNKVNTSNFLYGLFVVYVLSPDFRRFYLTIIIGVKDKTPEELEYESAKMRIQIKKPEGFVEGLDGSLTKFPYDNSSAYKYEKAVVYSKRYDLNNLPDEATFRTDLKNALTAHHASI